MAIIKYKESFIGRTNTTYEEVVDPNKKGKILSKEEAIRRIEELGLVRVLRNEYGTIWDTPDGEFLEKYHGVDINTI